MYSKISQRDPPEFGENEWPEASNTNGRKHPFHNKMWENGNLSATKKHSCDNLL